MCSLANYSVAYEETQSNQVSDFRDFVCSLVPKAIFFDFYLYSKNAVNRGIHYFLISAQNIDCGYSLEPPCPTLYVLGRNMKIIRFFFM